MLRTEYEFELPLGYVDADGDLHRDGVMRLATAADEILPLRDPRVRSNEAYLTVILMSRVITRLGSVERVTPAVIEGLFAADLGFLQDLYNRVNAPPGTAPPVEEPFTRAAEAIGPVPPPAKRPETTAAHGAAPERGSDAEGGGWRTAALEPVSLGGSSATP